MGKPSFPVRVSLVLAGLLLTNVSILAKARHLDVESLDPNSRALFRVSMRWGDESWDPQTKFLRAPQAFSVASPGEAHAADGHAPNHFLVRDSTWYALGLLLRDKPGDRDRAAQQPDHQRNHDTSSRVRRSG